MNRPSAKSPIKQTDDWMQLNLMEHWKFLNLRQAFEDMVHSNMVGDARHPLVREVAYKRDESGSVYFEPLHMQRMLMCRPYLVMVELQLSESNRSLVKFGPGKTIVILEFVPVSQNV